MSSDSSIKMFTLNYKDIKNLEVISFVELPEEKRKLIYEYTQDSPADGFDIMATTLQLFENCMMNPKRMEEIEQLTPEEFFDLFWKWVITSTIEESDDSDE